MIKKIKVKILAQPEKIIEKEIYICDICGKETNHIKKCYFCERDICWSNCNKHCSKDDPTEIGDYPARFCPICYKLRFEKYNKEINEIQEEADKKIELIIKKIKQESLKSK